MTTHKLALGILFAGAVQLATIPAADAGGPLANCADGVPFLWPNGGADIEMNLDQGGLGPFNNAEADAFVNSSLDAWASVRSATLSYVQGADIPNDIDETNFGPIFSPAAPNGQSEVVYDEDGAIFAAVFGAGSGILGFAGPDFGDPTDCTLIEGSAFINGAAIPVPDNVNLAFNVIVHELGHFNNLAHSQTTGALFLGDTSGPTPNNTFGNPPAIQDATIETMYPFLFTGVDQGTATLERDDRSALSALYPQADYAATTVSISGSVLAPNGTTRVSGVNVIARNVDDPFADAVSALSGDRTDINDPDISDFAGTFLLTGLTPDATYQVFIDEIEQGGFSTPPQQPLPGDEEFWSGADESSSDGQLNPADISAAAGETVSGVNIIFNTLQPGDPIPTGPFGDNSTELFLPFPFDFCGQRFNTVNVNGNGNVSFGIGSTDFTESAGDALAGPPRIAGFWDDLNSSTGGILTFDTDGETFFQLIWNEVPEFFSTGSNSFTITLDRKNTFAEAVGPVIGNRFEVEHGVLSAVDGLTGYSCGGDITNGFESETDLSGERLNRRLGDGAASLFEQWTNSGLDGETTDLGGLRVSFDGVGAFADPFEGDDDSDSDSSSSSSSASNNNTLADASDLDDVDNPDVFTAIAPLGDDIDFYNSIELNAGDFVAIQVTRGNLDSLIGVFDADTGELLFVDDDGGEGLLSRAILQANVDLNIAVAVTTFPDFGFTGAGGSDGRYLLEVQTYGNSPEVLSLGDDDSVEVALANGFPFQGEIRSSVFVNSNGNLTFGAGNTDFSESVAELLAGPPRIAQLWDDLDPTGTFGFGSVGLYLVETGNGSTTIHGVSLSEFFATDPNYFSVELDDDGDISIDYGTTGRSDALVGVTEGGGVDDPGPTDLSAAGGDSSSSSSDGGGLPATGTTYENFPFFPTRTTPFSNFDAFFDGFDFEDDVDSSDG